MASLPTGDIVKNMKKEKQKEMVKEKLIEYYGTQAVVTEGRWVKIPKIDLQSFGEGFMAYDEDTGTHYPSNGRRAASESED